jgi:hypothetical protein
MLLGTHKVSLTYSLGTRDTLALNSPEVAIHSDIQHKPIIVSMLSRAPGYMRVIL